MRGAALGGRWDYSTSACAGHGFHGDGVPAFEFGPPSEKRIHLHWDCADEGTHGGLFEYALVTLWFDAGSFLARASSHAEHRSAVEEVTAKDEVWHLRGGLDFCAPIALCLHELQDMRGMTRTRRDVHWWRRRANLSEGRAGHFLCSALLWTFLGRSLGLTRALASLPPPTPAECTASFADVALAWRAHTAPTPLWPRPRPALAVCIQGGVRTFTRPEVHESIRRNLVLPAAASLTRVFYVLNSTSDTCTWCERNEVRSFGLAELVPAMEAIGRGLTASIVLEPGCCWPALSPGLAYSDCFWDNIAAPVQARGKLEGRNPLTMTQMSRGLADAGLGHGLRMPAVADSRGWSTNR
ncbi:unnamed protein product [Prorocentrum cordatum]|uniref:Alpha-galactosidase n=1 Tax=Prorocentrum cordatum TaxID=2364126 RepID=A0ABN9PAP1_9DINO|nr:unnamed protein product [Polarella glacialis]